LMVVEENKQLETLRFLANSRSVVEAFAGGDPEEIRSQALGIAINQGADSIEFLDENANLVLAMRHIPGGEIEDYTFTTGGYNSQYKDLDFVKKVIDNQDDLLGLAKKRSVSSCLFSSTTINSDDSCATSASWFR